MPARPTIACKASVASTATSERTPKRRAVRRTPFRVPCRVRLVDPATGQARTLVGETLNLSRAGLAMQVCFDAPVGTWVETLVPHPNGDPLFLRGRVVHSRRTMIATFELGVALQDDGAAAF